MTKDYRIVGNLHDIDSLSSDYKYSTRSVKQIKKKEKKEKRKDSVMIID